MNEQKLDKILEKLESLEIGQKELKQTTARIEQVIIRLEENPTYGH